MLTGFCSMEMKKPWCWWFWKWKKEYFGHLRPIFPALQSGTRLIGWLQGDYAINYGLFYGFFSPAKMRIEYDRVDQWSLINGSGHHPHKHSFHTLCWNAWHNTEPNQLYPERGQWNLKTGYNTHTHIYIYIIIYIFIIIYMYITSSPFTMAIRWHIIYIHTHTFSVYIIYTHAYVHIYVERHAHINCTYRHILYLGSWIL